MKKTILLLALLLAAGQAPAVTGWNDPVTLTPTGASSPRLSLSSNGYSAAWLAGNTVVIRDYAGRIWSIPLPAGRNPEFDFTENPDGSFRGLAVSSSNLYRFHLDPSEGKTFLTNLGVPKSHSPRVFRNGNRFVEIFTVIGNEHHRLFLHEASSLTVPDGFDPTPLPEGSASSLGSFFPECLVSARDIRVVFTARTADENRRRDSVWMTVRSNTGRWSAPVRLSDPLQNAQFPFLSSRGEKEVSVSFSQTSSNRTFSLVLLHSTNTGRSFNTTIATDFVIPLFHPRILLLPDGPRLFAYDRYFEEKSSLLTRPFREETGWGQILRLTASNRESRPFVTANRDKKTFLAWIQDEKAILLMENDTSVEPPSVTSPDIHPDYANSFTDPAIVWTAPADSSGIKGFAWLLDRFPESEPDIINLDGTVRSRVFRGLTDGDWTFHIRTIDGNDNWSTTARYRFTIDTSLLGTPLVSSPSHPSFSPVADDLPRFVWSMPAGNRKKIIGYSTLLTRDPGEEPPERVTTSATSVSFPRTGPGFWTFKIRACDAHSNWSATAQVSINVETPRISVRPETEQTNEGVYIYIVKPGDIFNHVIRQVLGLRDEEEARFYSRELALFNELPDMDQIVPGTRIFFPALTAEKDTDPESLARELWGDARFKNRITLPGQTNISSIRAGELVLLRDRSFLRTGKIRSIKVLPEQSSLRPEESPLLFP